MDAEENEKERTRPIVGIGKGTRIGHYRILERIGVGGMGEVYLAEDLRLDRRVALKFVSPFLCDDPNSLARFTRETRAIARIDHPNIVTLHEVGEYDRRPYLVMQHVEGQSLADFPRGTDLPIAKLLDLGIQICAGLQAAHDAGVVHRDIKPSNILVDGHDRARIVDFGLASFKDSEGLTAPHSLLGTLGYISPEQVRGEEVRPQSDLFALGVVLYELLTGSSPFPKTSEAAFLHAVVMEDPKPLSELREDVPEGLRTAIETALAKDPASRQPTAADLAAELRRLLQDPGAPQIPSRGRPAVAVLPFEDMSPHHDQEYFCDGIAEELITALTHVRDLRVIARTSAFTFKGRHEDIREIGRKLGVEMLVEGSVRQSGKRVRVHARLVSVKDGAHIWAEEYERDLQDIFAIQDEVCLAIVERLKVSLLEGEKARLIKRRANDPQSYNLYLKGRFFFNQRKEEGVSKSISCYRKALEIDPQMALAHAGLADSYAILGGWRTLPRDTAYGQARAAALTAIALDSSLAEGHVALGTIRMFGDWDWKGAEDEFHQALAANPASGDAHHMLAHCHAFTGRRDRALSSMKRALEFEPIAPGLNSCHAEILFYARDYAGVEQQCHVTLEMAPSFFGVYGWLGIAQVQGGDCEPGIETLQVGLRHLPADARLQALLGFALASVGRRAEAQECVGRLTVLSTQKFVDSYFLAWPRTALGDLDEAFTCLDRAFDEHSDWLAAVKVDPLLDGLRSDSRFVDMLERLRLQA
jgi:serine/threonine protein kinase/tetratricopeptide (TPR) repeat protein